MANQVPELLVHLIELNIDFEVLVCTTCYKAITPTGINQHMRKIYNLEPNLRNKLRKYMNSFTNSYSPSTIRLPANSSAPQPILPIVDGFQCKHCDAFLTTSRKWMKMHGNKEHKLKRVVDEELFNHVRLQSWFPESRERYWVVNESIAREHSQGAMKASNSRRARRARSRSRDSEEHSSGEHVGEHAGENARENSRAHSGEHVGEHAPALGRARRAGRARGSKRARALRDSEEHSSEHAGEHTREHTPRLGRA